MEEQLIQLEHRMYSLVIYQLSGIQAGIQSGHAVEEYYDKYKDTDKHKTYRRDKTWIVLNGGTSNSGKESYYDLPKQLGTMEQHLINLNMNYIECTPFYEPDLNYCLTAIAFVVDERVFDKEKYPDFKEYIISKQLPFNSQSEIMIRMFSYDKLKYDFPGLYNKWLSLIGGSKNEFLREFLKDKKLA